MIFWMIKLMKLKFVSICRKSVARVQRFFFSRSYRRLFLSAIKIFTRFSRAVKTCFRCFITDVKRCFDSCFFFFSCVKNRSNFFSKDFLRRCRSLRRCSFFRCRLWFFLFDSFASSSFSESDSMTLSLFFSQFLTTRQQTKTSFVTINRNVDSFDKIRSRFRALHSRFLSFIDQSLTNWDIMLIKIASN